MSYGRLAVIKTIGERPIFVILDKDENILTTVPDFNDWMFKRIGKIVTLFQTDIQFSVTDEDKKREEIG